MMTIIHRYPGIKKAALEIAYDNGMINRFVSPETFLKSCNPALSATGVDVSDLKKLDDWLMGLDNQDLETVCCGEQTDMEGISLTCPTGGPDNVKLVFLLNDIFDTAG